MILFHLTMGESVSSIRLFGLLTSEARGTLPAVWFVPYSLVREQAVKVARSHYGSLRDVRVLRYDLPRGLVYRASRSRWLSLCDISPDLEIPPTRPILIGGSWEEIGSREMFDLTREV